MLFKACFFNSHRNGVIMLFRLMLAVETVFSLLCLKVVRKTNRQIHNQCLCRNGWICTSRRRCMCLCRKCLTCMNSWRMYRCLCMYRFYIRLWSMNCRHRSDLSCNHCYHMCCFLCMNYLWSKCDCPNIRSRSHNPSSNFLYIRLIALSSAMLTQQR